MSHDCKKCKTAHAVCLDEKPDDEGVYAYLCPKTQQESKFRFKEMAFRLVEKCEPGSVKAYRSKA
jgi:hypothetical protein